MEEQIKNLKDAYPELDVSPSGEPIILIEILKQRFDISKRLRNCLVRAGYISLNEAAKKTDKELLKINNFGEKCLNELNLLCNEYEIMRRK